MILEKYIVGCVLILLYQLVFCAPTHFQNEGVVRALKELKYSGVPETLKNIFLQVIVEGV